MSIIDWPRDHRDFLTEDFELWPVQRLQVSRAVVSGYPKTRELAGTRWACAFTLSAGTWRQRARQAALLESLQGGANRLRLWHLARPRPYGTITGSPVVQAAAGAGAKTIVLQTAAPGESVEAGDMLGLGAGGPLVRVAATARSDSSSILTLTLTHGLWADVAINAPVFVIRPTALFIPTGELRTESLKAGNVAEPLSLQFEEVFE